MSILFPEDIGQEIYFRTMNSAQLWSVMASRVECGREKAALAMFKQGENSSIIVSYNCERAIIETDCDWTCEDWISKGALDVDLSQIGEQITYIVAAHNPFDQIAKSSWVDVIGSRLIAQNFKYDNQYDEN